MSDETVTPKSGEFNGKGGHRGANAGVGRRHFRAGDKPICHNHGFQLDHHPQLHVSAPNMLHLEFLDHCRQHSGDG